MVIKIDNIPKKSPTMPSKVGNPTEPVVKAIKNKLLNNVFSSSICDLLTK